jgi:hypothetical protein
VPDDDDPPRPDAEPPTDGPPDPDTPPPAPAPDAKTPGAYPATDPALGPEADAGTTRALSAFLTITPFLDLHERAGGNHPWRQHLCFACDFVIRLAVVVLLLGILTVVAVKTLAPIPAVWD